MRRGYVLSCCSYLSPEPLLQNPEWLKAKVELGQQVPAYGYAANNPIGNTDEDGLQPRPSGPNTASFCSLNPGACAPRPPSQPSFCTLNPGACPSPKQPDSCGPNKGPKAQDLDACLKACEAGGEAVKNYCRGLDEAWKRAICWSVVLGSVTACKGMCYRIN